FHSDALFFWGMHKRIPGRDTIVPQIVASPIFDPMSDTIVLQIVTDTGSQRELRSIGDISNKEVKRFVKAAIILGIPKEMR
ncbi:hypothetical protein, partial [Planococcus sp. CAU13]|uniref:hypothetical protein n=1 Tax=Planococcus sp. CAU13 TaxID=1541197 RepID=UPI00052FF562